MKYLVLCCRIILGVGFTLFGANHILGFLKMPVVPGNAGIFGMLMFSQYFFAIVGVLQLAGGLLLVSDRFVPLALSLLGPILANILLFNFLFEGATFEMLGPGLFLAVMWGVVFSAYIRSFRPLFVMRALPSFEQA